MRLSLKILCISVIASIFTSCGSKNILYSDFERVLYPNGRFFSVVQIDETSKLRLEALLLEGSRLKMLGDLKNSTAFYQEALQIDSTCATCYFEIGKLLISVGDLINAEKYIFEAVKYDPDNEFFLLLLSQLYAENKKLELAIKSADFLVNRFPTNVDYLLHLVSLHQVAGNFSEAVSVLRRVQNIVGINEPLSLKKHALLMNDNKHRLALRELHELSDAFPNNNTFRVYIGDFHFSNGDLRKAYNIFQEVVESDSANGEVHFSLANYYNQVGDSVAFKKSLINAVNSTNLDFEIKFQTLLPFLGTIDDSLSFLSEADVISILTTLTTIHPFESNAFLLKGNFFRHLERDSLSAIAFREALVIDPYQEEVWQQLLIYGSAAFTDEEMLNFAIEASSLFPDNGFFLYAAGFKSTLNNLYHQAASYLLRASDLTGNNVELQSQVLGLLGDIHFKLGEPSKSFDFYERSLELVPDNIVVLNNFAYYLSLEGVQLERAKEMINRVIDVEPFNPVFLDTQAWVLFKMGQYAKALIVIEKAIEHGGYEHGVILEHYGDILYMNGYMDRAIDYWKRALQSDDDVSDMLTKKIENRTFIPCE